MSRRSERKTRHNRPYELWKRPTPMDQLVDLVREATGRFPESAYEQTVTLTKAEDVRHFERGPNILDMPEEEARAILGSEVYDTLMAAKNDPRPQGTCVVTSIGGADKETR
jgi:hypothetical protein